MGRASVHSVALYKGQMPLLEGFPDVEGVVWNALGAQRAYATYFGGTDQFATIEVTGEDPYANVAPEVPGIINTRGVSIFGADPSKQIRRLQLETLTIRCPIVAPDAGSDFTSVPFHQILEVCEWVESAVVTTTVDAAGGHAGEFTVPVGEGADFIVGEGLELVKNGLTHQAFVTGIAGDSITVTGEWTDAVEAGDVIRHCRTYAPRRGAIPPADLVSLEFISDGLAHYIIDCALIGLQTVIEENVLFMDFTLRPASQVAIQSTAAGLTMRKYTRPLAPSVSPLQACRKWSPVALGTIAAPEHVPLGNFDLIEFAWAVKIGGSPDNGCGPLVTEEGFEYAGSKVNLTGRSYDVVPFDRHFITKQRRQILLGFGPPGQGACIATLNAHMPEPETRETDDNKRQIVNFRFENGGWSGDEVVGNGVDNTDWRIAFPKPDAA